MRRCSVGLGPGWYLSRLRDEAVGLGLCLLAALLSLAASLLAHEQAARSLLRGLSLADHLVAAASPSHGWSALCMVVAPSSVAAFALVTRHDFMANIIVRSVSMRALWLRQGLALAQHAALFSLLVTAAAVVAGAWLKGPAVNFSQRDSLFALHTFGATMADPPIVAVVGAFFAFCLGICLLFGALSMVLRWLTGCLWLPVALTALVGVFDSLPFGFKIIYHRASIGYAAWLDPAQGRLWLPFAAALLLFAAGLALAPQIRALRSACGA